ncbi:ATP-binding cassette domain-containing protein [Actinomyces sp. 186855]|uniref:ABC transporter ATP-binding protein n=1 Tax=Actinomyces sp. 186855 TaxID=2761164 RepID=UPI002017AA1B|nr:ATP-binding cassette domain-containing protein [Actinomyces sp. 186855]MCL3792022.1 ATP-binding cassette domain-containing protein [Actinomyces sp. 186855]
MTTPTEHSSARPGTSSTSPRRAPELTFEAVTKRYRGTAPPAVDGFTATLAAGHVTVLLGSSGCGKTTLLRMVNHMVAPTSGRVLLDGADVAERNAVTLRRSIGYVMQNAGLLPHRSVIDNITLVPRLDGVPRATARQRAAELMDMLGLASTLADRYPHELSGGQAQRVGVARALASDPGVLLMDEPFGAVDPLVRRELQRELWRIQAGLAKTIVFVTHDVDEALALGDDIILLREGAQVSQRGTGTDLLQAPADDFVVRFLGLDDDARAHRLRQVADATDARCGRTGPAAAGGTGAAQDPGTGARS